MREATGEFNYTLALEVCKAILNAETAEEVETIKTNLPIYFKENGMSEEEALRFMSIVDTMLEMIEKEELVFDEKGNLVRNNEEIQETAEVGVPAPTPTANLNFGEIAGNIFGIAAGAVVICLALKNKVFNNKKSEDREDPWER